LCRGSSLYCSAAGYLCEPVLDMRPCFAALDIRNAWPGDAIVAGDVMVKSGVRSDRDYVSGFKLVAAMSSLVMSLLQPRTPATVGGFIPAVDVNPVDGQIWRTFSHISEEIFKRRPAFTDLDTPSTVVALLVARWSASHVHRFPDPIRPPLLAAACEAMLHAVFSLASAIHASPIAQVVAQYFPLNATVTSAEPFTVKTCMTGFCQNGPCSEPLVDEISHGI